MQIYDGTSSSGNLLWNCEGCEIIPGPIFSSSGQIYVVYNSISSSTFTNTLGQGFRAFYWLLKTPSMWLNDSTGNLLESPPGLELTNSPDNVTMAWKLGTTDSPSNLIFSPNVLNVSRPLSNELIVDGRRDDYTIFESMKLTSSICGRVVSAMPTYLSGRVFRSSPRPYVSMMADQYASSYIRSSIAVKDVYAFDFQRVVDPDLPPPASLSNFNIGNTCKYELNSNSTRAISIFVKSFESNRLGNLLIYGGIYGSDKVLLSALAHDVSETRVIAPCGVATIILELNTSSVPLYTLDLEYNTVPEDHGELCIEYSECSPLSFHPILLSKV
jgi:hypothetical protein